MVDLFEMILTSWQIKKWVNNKKRVKAEAWCETDWLTWHDSASDTEKHVDWVEKKLGKLKENNVTWHNDDDFLVLLPCCSRLWWSPISSTMRTNDGLVDDVITLSLSMWRQQISWLFYSNVWSVKQKSRFSKNWMPYWYCMYIILSIREEGGTMFGIIAREKT